MFRQVLKTTAFKRNASSSAKSIFVGRLGNDPVITSLNDGKEVANYSVAIQYSKDGPVNWFTISTFAPSAIEYIKNYVRKGALVYVEANPKTRVVAQDDGTNSYSVNFIQTKLDVLKFPYNPEGKGESEASD